MDDIRKKRFELSEKLFKDVINMKVKSNVTTNDICIDLNLEEDVVSNYFLGLTKENLYLGIKLLDYLEKKENI